MNEMYHTPKETKKNLEIISALRGFNFEDTSTLNDESDSVWDEKKDIHIFFPCAKNEYDKFLVSIGKFNPPFKITHEEEFNTLEEVIKFLKKK
jgi:hypothetical protein